MTTSETALLTVLGSIAFFAVVWCFVLAIVAWASGWRRLAARYAASPWVAHGAGTIASARIGLAHYTGALQVAATESGLQIKPLRIFRPFHPPLLIPWTEIESDGRDGRFLGALRMTFRSVPRVSIVLYGRGGACARSALQRIANGRTATGANRSEGP